LLHRWEFWDCWCQRLLYFPSRATVKWFLLDLKNFAVRNSDGFAWSASSRSRSWMAEKISRSHLTHFEIILLLCFASFSHFFYAGSVRVALCVATSHLEGMMMPE
jgi:hypothetical protein